MTEFGASPAVKPGSGWTPSSTPARRLRSGTIHRADVFRRVAARRTCGIAILVAVVTLGCSGDNDSASMSVETADVQCELVAEAFEQVARSQNLADPAVGAKGLELLRSVAVTVEGTELSTLTQVSVAAFAAKADGDPSDFSEWASVVLEARRSQAAVGLWCIEHTSDDASVKLAHRFLETSW